MPSTSLVRASLILSSLIRHHRSELFFLRVGRNLFSALEAWVAICGRDALVPDVMLVSVRRIEGGSDDGMGVDGTDGFDVSVEGCEGGRD